MILEKCLVGANIVDFDDQSYAYQENDEDNQSITIVYSNYCNGEEARNYLMNEKNWRIIDSGKDCSGSNSRVAEHHLDDEFVTIQAYPNPVLDLLQVRLEQSASVYTNYLKENYQKIGFT